MLDRKSLDHITISEKLILFISNLRQKSKAVRWAFWIMITIISFYSLFIPLIILPICFIVVLARTHKYYKTDEFRNLSSRIKKQIDEYNEFDNFMQETRQFIFDKQKELSDTNFRDSSLTIYKNSKLNPYGYIVKYFFKDKKVDESTMQTIEQVMQKYETIQKTYSILEDEYLEIMNFVNKKMYIGAYVFKKTTMRNLGSRVLPKFNKDYYMQYSFSYVSPTNRNKRSNDIVLDENRLQEFAEYLNGLIVYRKSARYQRQLMTSALREKILNRDNFQCLKCHVSSKTEKHLLLEVDHIIPISKGGITIEKNLQTLCWKCNRSKGTKIL